MFASVSASPVFLSGLWSLGIIGESTLLQAHCSDFVWPAAFLLHWPLE